MKLILLSAAFLAALLGCADAQVLPGPVVTGSGNTSGGSATTIIAAPTQSGFKLHPVGVQCKNTGSVSTAVVLNDSAGTVIMAPAGSGDNGIPYWPGYLTVAVNTALTFTPMTASTTIYCNAQAFVSTN